MKIKPAGWVVIFLGLGGLGYAGWRTFGQHLRTAGLPTNLFANVGASADAGTSPDAGSPRDAVPVDAGPLLDAGGVAPEGPTDDGGGFDLGHLGGIDPTETADAGPVSAPTVAVARSLPPLSTPPTVIAGSEGAALHLVATEQVQDAVVSVAALAAHPEAVAFGVRAVWLVGETTSESNLLPSCDVAQLRAARLGVIGGSIAHLHLLTLLEGAPLPPLLQFDSEAALEAAYADGSVNGGEAPLSRRALMATNCVDAGRKPDALVLVHKAGRPVSKTDVAAATLLQGTPPGDEQQKSFFARQGSETFEALYRKASQKWLESKVIPALASPSEAMDLRLVERLTPATALTPAGANSASSVYGFRSWVDTHSPF
jgi:hypothetical protein